VLAREKVADLSNVLVDSADLSEAPELVLRIWFRSVYCFCFDTTLNLGSFGGFGSLRLVEGTGLMTPYVDLDYVTLYRLCEL
jgi:hypothetical protein